MFKIMAVVMFVFVVNVGSPQRTRTRSCISTTLKGTATGYLYSSSSDSSSSLS
jgi:hypothetical protein